MVLMPVQELRLCSLSEAVHSLHNTIQQGNSAVFLSFIFSFLFFFICWQTMLSEGCCFRTGIPHIDIMRSLLKLFRNHLAFYCPFILGACPTTWGKKTVSALNSTFFRCLLHNGALRTKVIALSFYCSFISPFWVPLFQICGLSASGPHGHPGIPQTVPVGSRLICWPIQDDRSSSFAKKKKKTEVLSSWVQFFDLRQDTKG